MSGQRWRDVWHEARMTLRGDLTFENLRAQHVGPLPHFVYLDFGQDTFHLQHSNQFEEQRQRLNPAIDQLGNFARFICSIGAALAHGGSVEANERGVEWVSQ